MSQNLKFAVIAPNFEGSSFSILIALCDSNADAVKKLDDRALHIKFNLEDGDTSMSDTIEIEALFDVPAEHVVHGERVVMTVTEMSEFMWFDVLELIEQHNVTCVMITNNDGNKGKGSSVSLPDGVYSSEHIKDWVEARNRRTS